MTLEIHDQWRRIRAHGSCSDRMVIGPRIGIDLVPEIVIAQSVAAPICLRGDRIELPRAEQSTCMAHPLGQSAQIAVIGQECEINNGGAARDQENAASRARGNAVSRAPRTTNRRRPSSLMKRPCAKIRRSGGHDELASVLCHVNTVWKTGPSADIVTRSCTGTHGCSARFRPTPERSIWHSTPSPASSAAGPIPDRSSKKDWNLSRQQG